MNLMILLLFAYSQHFGVILIGGIYQTGCLIIREGHACNTILTDENAQDKDKTKRTTTTRQGKPFIE